MVVEDTEGVRVDDITFLSQREHRLGRMDDESNTSYEVVSTCTVRSLCWIAQIHICKLVSYCTKQKLSNKHGMMKFLSDLGVKKIITKFG